MRFRCHTLSLLAVLFIARLTHAQMPWPVPAQIASDVFTVTLDGQPTPVMHAAENVYFLNFPAKKHLKVTVTSQQPDLWAKGVEIEPWRLGIRPVRIGPTLAFTLDGPEKITISQPRDMLAEAPTLFLFANPPEDAAAIARPGVRVYGPGAHHENIDAATGDTIYLAPGAVIFGALNIWQVANVHVFGRGVIVYDGPQNPDNDDGWMHKKNWHCIVMDEAHDISIEGVTCVVRSRTWQIQMKDSHNIVYDNLKVIGVNKGNANADGMDWLGGGDTVVRNSFFLAADDVFAMQGSWEGYGPVAFAVEGHPVANITVENTEVSTSISNIVRAAWPEKNFVGGHFHMRNSDVLHMGMGGCGIPFALMEVWADPHGRGKSGDYTFDDIRLEHWGTLFQVMEDGRPGTDDGVSGVHFTNISALELPALLPSVTRGNVTDITFDSPASLPIRTAENAPAPTYTAASNPRIEIPAGLIQPGEKIKLEALNGPADAHYTWLFGDGSSATGRRVKHRFPDADGTLLDASGRFRVMLETRSADGRTTYITAPIVIASGLQPAATTTQPATPGLLLADGSTSPTVAPTSTPSQTYTGYLNIPADGGYTLTLVANDTSSITLDGHTYTTPKPFAQVCNLAGNAPQPVTLTAALAKGSHTLVIHTTHTTGEDDLKLLWQAPNQPVTEVPASQLTH